MMFWELLGFTHFFFIISRRASNKFGSTSTKYMLIACKGADFIGHLQRFTSISLSILPLHYLYIHSTTYLPTHQLLSLILSWRPQNSSNHHFRGKGMALSGCSDGTFESFRWHFRGCSQHGNTLFLPRKHFVSPKGTSRNKHGNVSRQAWELIEV